MIFEAVMVVDEKGGTIIGLVPPGVVFVEGL